MPNRMIRQGDVLLIERDAPENPVRTDAAGLRVPGERTGHAHLLPAEVFVADGRRLLHLAEDTPMTHEEHADVLVPAGWFEPVLQREFSPSSRPTARAQFD